MREWPQVVGVRVSLVETKQSTPQREVRRQCQRRAMGTGGGRHVGTAHPLHVELDNSI